MEKWMREALSRARAAAAAAAEKKASDIVLLDMRELSAVADIFMICGVSAERQLKAVADEIQLRLEPKLEWRIRRDGISGSPWVVMDLGGVLVHIFLEEERRRLELEKLWGDAPRFSPRLKVPGAAKNPVSSEQ